MSDNKQKNGSPSGAGKSLALMQQRLLSKSESEEAKVGTERTATSGTMAPGGQPTQPPATVAVAQNRPKGKDFAAMAMNATKNTPAPAPIAPAAASPAPNRPKGKDFAAMANRAMPPQSVHPQDPDRAAKMQAAARAAAGLPPLTQPTATSVTTIPPPIAATVPAPRPAQQQHPAPAPAVAPPPSYKPPQGSMSVPMRGAPLPSPMAVDPRQQQQSIPRPMHETVNAGPQQAVRRNAMTRPPPLAPPVAVPPFALTPAPKPVPKPTPQPTAAEARLSMSAVTAGVRAGGPHQSPLIGQRLRDLVSSLDPNYVLDAQAEEQVLHLADDFLDKVTRQALRLAQHRGSRTLDIQDVQLALSKQWGIIVPGLGPPVLRPTKPAYRASASGGTKRRASSTEKSEPAPKKAKSSSSNTATSKTS